MILSLILLFLFICCFKVQPEPEYLRYTHIAWLWLETVPILQQLSIRKDSLEKGALDMMNHTIHSAPNATRQC